MGALIPKAGTLERIFLEKAVASESVSYLDFIGTGITEENIDQIVRNLRYGMFEAENDDELRPDT